MEAKGLFGAGQHALLPLDDRAREIIGTLKPGDKVLVKVHRARNPEHNALAHVVFTRIADAIGQPMNVVKLYLKWETGYVDLVQLPDGRHIASPRSLSFETLTQDEFQAWWDDALPIIAEKIIPGLPEFELEEIRAIIAGKAAAT